MKQQIEDFGRVAKRFEATVNSVTLLSVIRRALGLIPDKAKKDSPTRSEVGLNIAALLRSLLSTVKF